MTLTEVSYYTRRVAPFLALFIIVIFIFYYSIKLIFIFGDLNKKEVVYTNPIFGSIKQINIAKATSSAGLKFTLDTIEGKPITATKSGNVYFLPQSTPRFGYRQKIYLMAKMMGINTGITKHRLNGRVATFKEGRRYLKIDIGNFNFNYDYNFTQEKGLFDGNKIPSQKEITNKAISYLKKIGRYPEELSQGKTNIVYFSYNPETTETKIVKNAQKAQMVEVDFYRPDINGYAIASPKYFNSQNYVLLLFKGAEAQILRAQISFFEKTDDQVGIYLLKTGDQAYADLQSGKGLIVSFPNKSKDIIIKEMHLGYFDPDIYQEYLQPVYVFLGKDHFVAYVSAIVDNYIGH